MAPLPQELIDAIVEQIFDNATLQSCVLTATCFRAAAQRRLFCTLRLRCACPELSPLPEVEDILERLTSSPRIASYARKVAIQLPNHTETVDADLESKRESAFHALERVLRLLPRPESLLFNGSWNNWSTLGPGATAALLECIARPSMNECHMYLMFSVPAALLKMLVRVPIVSLACVFPDTQGEDYDNEDPEEAEESLRLHHLILPDPPSRVSALHDFFLRAGDSGCLRALKRVELRQDLTDYVERLLAVCADTLEHVAIYVGVFDERLGPIDLPKMTNVRFIKLEYDLVKDRKLPFQFLKNLESIGAALPRVETVSFVFAVEAMREDEPDWGNCDYLPTVGPLFKAHTCIRYVRCSVRVLSGRSASEALRASFEAAMERSLGGLRELGILEISVADSL